MKKLVLAVLFLGISITAYAAVREFRFVQIDPQELTTDQVLSIKTALEPSLCPKLDSTYSLTAGKTCSLAKYFRYVPTGRPCVHICPTPDGKWEVSGTAALPIEISVITDAEVSP